MESPIKKPSQGAEVSAVRRGAPWWIWVVAAAFVLNFALVIYLDLVGPILGARVAPTTSGGVFVTEIYPGAPAAVAGLQSGDRIRRVDGLLIGSYLNWVAVLFNLKVDEPRTFEIQRGNETLILSVVPKQRWFLGYEGPSLLGHVLWRIGQLVMLGLACFLASARPRDRSALIVSLFFAGLSLSNVPETMTGVNAMLRQLPTVLFALFYISWVAVVLTAPLFFTFCATFPRPLLRSRRLWMLIWMPYLLMLAPVAVLANPVIFDSHHAIGTFSIALYVGLALVRFCILSPE